MPGPTVLAVDLGGTRTRAALVGPDGALLVVRAEPTVLDPERPTGVVALAADVLGRAEGAGATAVERAVVAVPGRVDHRRGALGTAANIPPAWMRWLTEERLSADLGLPVRLANDADCAAVGEAYFGAGRGAADVVYLTVSTGVGAGAVLGGRVVAGARSGLEVGHTIIDRVAYRAAGACTVEGLGSGTAMNRAAAAAGLMAEGAEVVRRAAASDPVAAAVWATVVEAVGIAVVNLVWMLSPEVVVLGGGVGRNNPALLDGVRAALDRAGPPALDPPVRVVAASLGDHSALAGAAAWHLAAR